MSNVSSIKLNVISMNEKIQSRGKLMILFKSFLTSFQILDRHDQSLVKHPCHSKNLSTKNSRSTLYPYAYDNLAYGFVSESSPTSDTS